MLLCLFLFVLLSILGNDKTIELCCSETNPTQLISLCGNHSALQTKRVVQIATFASSNTWKYSSHMSIINSAYAYSHGYSWIVLSPESGDDFCPDDRRWNKIAIISKSLAETDDRFFDAHWLVFLDADVAVIDFDFDVLAFVQQYPNADLILSDDSIDVANVAI